MDRYDTILEEHRKKRKKEREEELAQWNKNNPDQMISVDDLLPVRTITDEDRTWFLEGLFGDGYNFGDATRTLMGTATDTSKNIIRGVLNAGEGILDAGTFAVGKAAETLGFDDFANKTYTFQQRNLVEEVNEKSKALDRILLGTPQELVEMTPKVIDEERMSLLGDKSDSLIQSAGQLGATIGLQGVGVPWWLTTGTTVFGQSSTEAMQQGATSNEAAAYGAISAGSEIIFERLSGGIKFGGKALDDGLKKLITDKISSKTLNTLARFGLDAAGEGVEEVLTEFATKIGEGLTFADEKTWGELLTSEEAMDNYLEAFIGGAVMGGGFNTGRVAKSLKTGRDYDTGFSDNEQTLINREVGRRTEERQKEAAVNAEVEKQISELSKTVNLSEAEKNNIKKRVREQLDNGELDFSTSKLSKKELAEIEEQVTEDLKKGYFDIDTIESTFAEAKTSRIRELIAERDNSSNEEKKAEIQKEIDQLTLEKNKEMQKFVTNDYWLQESYRQEVLKGESFTREAGRKDTDITKELEESAKAAGMNNTRKMHELFDYTNKIANDTDTRYGFINNKQLQSMGYAVKDATINGMVRVQEDGTTKVLINVDSGKALNTIIGHETTHLLEGTQEHQELIAAVKEYAQMKGDYDGRIKAVQELYKNVDANIENEVTADLVGDYIFTDEQFVMNLAKKPNVFQKVYDYVKRAYKMATAGSTEARQLLKAKSAFEKAYKSMPNSNVETDKYLLNPNFKSKMDEWHGNGDKFSIADTKGRELTKEQQEYFKGSKIRDENGNLKVMYHGTPDGSFTAFKDGSYFTENKSYADRYQNTNASSIGSGKIAANPKTFEVYLDIKKPFDLSDPVARDVYINDYIKGGNAIGINPYLSDAEYNAIETIDWTEGEDLRDFLIENEYDYDGLVLDEGADGGYGDDVLYRGKSYVVFSPEQVKNVTNENPTDDADIRFSLSKPVEENKNLVALHNLNAGTLLKQLDLGGMPMPSVAITDPSKVDHTGFGDVTLILNKEAIDPKKSKLNKVYSNDAYTPTFPQIRYEANEKVAERVADKVISFIDQVHDQFQGDLRRLRSSSEMDDLLNDEGGQQGVIDRFRNTYGMKQLYLAEKGETIPLETKRVEIPIDELKKETYEYIIEKMGEDAVRSSKNAGLTGRQWFDQHGEQIKQVYHDFFVEGGSTEEQVSNFINNRKPVYFVEQVRQAAKYLENGGVEVHEGYDYEKARNLIDEKIAQSDYDTWLNNLFDGIEGTSGIRNNKEIFTPSGNRRSFKQTHDPVTLDNIVKVMRGEAQQKGQAMFGGSMFGASAKEYKSIKEMKADSHRLGRLEEAENKESRDYIEDTIGDIARRYADGKDWWDARNTLIEAVGHSETKAGITKYLKQYDYVYKYDESVVDDLIGLRDYVRNLTVPYFESKPQRAVGFEEVGVYVIPNNADAELKRRLLEAGYSIAEYNPEIEGDRQKVVNQFENYKFSLSQNDIAPVGSYNVYGRDVKQRIIFDGITPIDESAASKTKTAEEDIAPVAGNDVWEADPSMFEESPEEPIADYNDTMVPMDKESMRLLTKNMKEVLGLNRTQRNILKNVIQDYSTGKISTPDDLYNTIAEQFGVQSYEYKNDEILTVKKALRETKVKVSDQMKDGIPDYFKFRQSNFGKIRFANDGMAIDDLYGALSEVYPGYFPADIVTQEDQLIRMAEVANLDSTIKEEYVLPDEKIAEATDFIRESVSEYKRGAKLKDSLKRRNADGTPTRKEIHANYMKKIKDTFTERGMDFDAVLSGAKNLSTFASVDNTPQRYMEKTFGYKEGQVLSDLTVNQAAENETAAIRWLNSFTNKKSGTLAELSRKYKIKPFSKEDAAAQKYAEGMYVNQYGDYVEYGDRQLEFEIKDPQMRANIKAFVRDPVIRKIYDETLDAINASRTRNGYPAIPRRNDYFLHFREMDDTFSRIGIPFNPNDIKAKDLPTDINGMTADNKPGQPYFASSMQRKGVGTTYSLLGGMEKYLTAAKPQIFHIDDIQILRALRNYTADTYGQAKGLESLDEMSDEEAEARIKQVYGAHLSTFAKFLNEEANIMAGKTALIDRGLEGVVGRRAITFMNTLNSQVAKNMIGFNLSSSLTNFVSVTQAAAKASKYDVIKAFSQTVSNKLKGIAGKSDGFAEKNSAIVRRKGQEKFYKKWWEKASDKGFIFMSAIDDVSTEFIVRTKYNELIRKGMSEDKAHDEAGKWAMRILGDRSFGQMPQIFNSKTLGLVTKFQLEVRNQLDSMFYDTVQEANLSTEEIQEGTKRNAVKAVKIASTVTQLAVFQHLFGKAFESVAGYNPTFDIIENLMILFGFDDEEDSEDTFTDNLEEALLGLGEDLPYFSAMTGGRIPIESALPIEQFVQGKDDYGNDKSRWETLGEALPYYISPTGANQIKKTAQGLKMFDKDLPVAGSYTESGSLRFPVEPTPENILQALLFGQWASKNAREYFDGEHKPLKENQIQEYKELDLPIAEYWKIREDMAKIPLNDDKVDYIDTLDLPLSKKNILVNNVLDRDEKVDMAGYGNYSSFEEFDFAVKNPDKYPMTKAVGGYEAYKKYSEELYEIKADKDEAGNSIRGTRKTKVIEYIEGMDADYGTKILLYKKEYPSDDSYNHDIIDYLNEREDISYAEMKTILESLDFTVDDEGNIWW